MHHSCIPIPFKNWNLVACGMGLYLSYRLKSQRAAEGPRVVDLPFRTPVSIICTWCEMILFFEGNWVMDTGKSHKQIAHTAPFMSQKHLVPSVWDFCRRRHEDFSMSCCCCCCWWWWFLQLPCKPQQGCVAGDRGGFGCGELGLLLRASVQAVRGEAKGRWWSCSMQISVEEIETHKQGEMDWLVWNPYRSVLD